MIQDLLDPNGTSQIPIVEDENEDAVNMKRQKSKRKRGRPRSRVISEISSNSESSFEESSDDEDFEFANRSQRLRFALTHKRRILAA